MEEILEKKKYIELTSFREDGSGVPTPVWFTLVDGKIYFETNSKSWKVKRIQKNPKVEICPCTYKGKVIGKRFEAEARVLEGEEAKDAKNLLQKKYGIMYRLLRFGSWIKRSKTNYYEVTPGTIIDS